MAADEPKIIPVSDRPHAPVVYFEAAPISGYANGTVSVTLSADLQLPEVDGVGVRQERVVAAYLRTTLQGAKFLRDVLDNALLLAQPPETATKN